MIVQAIVDLEYLFWDICVGCPGSVHDFENSLKITHDNLLSNFEHRVFNGEEIPLYIIGYSAYPIQTWFLKPFAQIAILTAEQKCFNYRLSCENCCRKCFWMSNNTVEVNEKK